MARTFRQRRSMHAVSELNVTNLLDLAFVLLIIFMIATPLITTPPKQSMAVNLPVESAREQPKPDKDDKTKDIIIQANGSCLLDGDSVSLGQMEKELARFAGEAKPPIFHIKMDASATAQQFISVMDALKKNGLSRISFDTQTKK